MLAEALTPGLDDPSVEHQTLAVTWLPVGRGGTAMVSERGPGASATLGPTGESASARVVRELRGMILSGSIPVGAQIPTEPDLCQMFGVGRSSIREAVRGLAAHGLVRTRRGVGGGTFVVLPEPDQISEDLEASFGLLSESRRICVQDLVDARRALEVPAAGLAASARSDEDLVALRHAVEAERRSPDEAFEGHGEVHRQILRAAGNDLLRIMAIPVFSVLATRFERGRAGPAAWKAIHDEHAEIVACIDHGDRRAAECAMDRHMDTLGSLYADLEGG